MFVAERFPAGQTKFAMTAGAVQPGDAYAIANLQMCNTGAEGGYDACAFVARDEWRSWLDGPVAFRRVQIGMAYTSGNNFYQSLTWSGGGYWHFLND